ncbi:hypothetical protein KJ657_00340 [Patescibacteria group bacterium]|nr:hypothetical protein [Patescibacteria group bacterium]MBU1015525.1 hypothetical protein [Patescibacteria group bacterium]MBU1685643.1 hypothetical protein [Patescibacteria group bacterium]MBU1938136.1 hypothetical protein [Patescibacteria group bacterium]
MTNRKLSEYTTKEMLELENLASEKYGVSTDQMMQMAGRSIYDFVAGELPGVKRVLVVAGKGNNGGDVLVAVDLLAMSGYEVTALRAEETFPNDFDFSRFDLIIDGLFGFSLRGNPRPPMDKIITLALGMPKRGLAENPEYAGKVYLGNLGIPAEVYREKGIDAPDFLERNYI